MATGAGPTSSHIRVVARFRPLSASEKERNLDAWAMKLGPDSISIPLNGDSGERCYSFDQVLDHTSDQRATFDTVAKGAVEDVLKGYHGTVFAYGQTGSGKTYTIFGEQRAPGIVPRSVNVIFDRLEERVKSGELQSYQVRVQFLEIHMGTMRDLLVPPPTPKQPAAKLSRRDDGLNVWVEGLTTELAYDAAELLELVRKGALNRVVGATKMNAESSRSHAVLIVSVQQKLADHTGRASRLYIVDLAGSERNDKSMARNKRLQEANYINQGLSFLEQVIVALGQGQGMKSARDVYRARISAHFRKHDVAKDLERALDKFQGREHELYEKVCLKYGETPEKEYFKKHVPYRNSPLTHILKPALGGNMKTTLVVACSPSLFNCAETTRTLEFARRARIVKNQACINKVEKSEAQKKKEEEERRNADLYRRNMEYQAQIKALAEENGGLKEQMKARGIDDRTIASNATTEKQLADLTERYMAVMHQVGDAEDTCEKAKKEKLYYERRYTDLEEENKRLNKERRSWEAEKAAADKTLQTLQARCAKAEEQATQYDPDAARRAVEEFKMQHAKVFQAAYEAMRPVWPIMEVGERPPKASRSLNSALKDPSSPELRPRIGQQENCPPTR